jgi:hypothetical protein
VLLLLGRNIEIDRRDVVCTPLAGVFGITSRVAIFPPVGKIGLSALPTVGVGSADRSTKIAFDQMSQRYPMAMNGHRSVLLNQCTKTATVPLWGSMRARNDPLMVAAKIDEPFSRSRLLRLM